MSLGTLGQWLFAKSVNGELLKRPPSIDIQCDPFVAMIAEVPTIFEHMLADRQQPLFPARHDNAGKVDGRENASVRLQIGQPAFGGKPDELGIRSHAGLGLYEIMIVLNGLYAEIEI